MRKAVATLFFMSHKNVYRTLSEIYNLPYASVETLNIDENAFSYL
jgi:hypothetical protein